MSNRTTFQCFVCGARTKHGEFNEQDIFVCYGCSASNQRCDDCGLTGRLLPAKKGDKRRCRECLAWHHMMQCQKLEGSTWNNVI